MLWVDYGGQDVSQYDRIGTDDLCFPITDGCDVESLVTELKRRCGRRARIKLFKDGEKSDGDR